MPDYDSDYDDEDDETISWDVDRVYEFGDFEDDSDED